MTERESTGPGHLAERRRSPIRELSLGSVGVLIATRDATFCAIRGTLSGMVDPILSTALSAFVGNIRGRDAELSEDAVVDAVGQEEARRLMPRLREIVDEAFRVRVDMKTHSYEPRERVQVSISFEHPELSEEAVRALGLYWHLSKFV